MLSLIEVAAVDIMNPWPSRNLSMRCGWIEQGGLCRRWTRQHRRRERRGNQHCRPVAAVEYGTTTI